MLGQVLMASLPEDEVDRILQKTPLASHTKNTTTDPYEFREKLARIRKQGYIIEDGEAIEGISGVAAPIYNFTGSVVAAVGVSFISSSVDAKGKEALLAEVLKAADAISQEMGYGGVRGPSVAAGGWSRFTCPGLRGPFPGVCR
jgi:DNA-binding IclR family transcriptional regulator